MVKEDLFSTNIRMPKHLAHKLGILASSEDRSLNSYMAMALEEYVTDFERDMSLAYEDKFEEVHESIFGKDAPPYITINITETDIGKAKTIIKSIPRGNQKSTTKGAPRIQGSRSIAGQQLSDNKNNGRIVGSRKINDLPKG